LTTARFLNMLRHYTSAGTTYTAGAVKAGQWYATLNNTARPAPGHRQVSAMAIGYLLKHHAELLYYEPDPPGTPWHQKTAPFKPYSLASAQLGLGPEAMARFACMCHLFRLRQFPSGILKFNEGDQTFVTMLTRAQVAAAQQQFSLA